MILENLMDATGLGQQDLYKIVRSAPLRYKVFKIPKRSGGEREIAQPSRPLKALQRILIASYIGALPIHESALAYRQGIGLRANALRHTDSEFILKLDFKNFFNSLTVMDWNKYVRRSNLELDSDDKAILRYLMFYGGGESAPKYLSVGAPSSPMLSNVLMYDFDVRVSAAAQQRNVTYTRYADDLTFSANRINDLLGIERDVTRIVAAIKSPNLTLNDAKRGLYSRAGKRLVTGLIVTPGGDVSIGRDRKRLISSMVDRIRQSLDLTNEHIAQTKGYIAFAIGCEPDFVLRLRRKYGDALIDRILRHEHQPKE